MKEGGPNQNSKKDIVKRAAHLGVAASVAFNVMNNEVDASPHDPAPKAGSNENVLDADEIIPGLDLETLKKGEALDPASLPMTVDLAQHIVSNADEFSEDVRQAALDFLHKEAQRNLHMGVSDGRFGRNTEEDQSLAKKANQTEQT